MGALWTCDESSYTGHNLRAESCQAHACELKSVSTVRLCSMKIMGTGKDDQNERKIGYRIELYKYFKIENHLLPVLLAR